MSRLDEMLTTIERHGPSGQHLCCLCAENSPIECTIPVENRAVSMTGRVAGGGGGAKIFGYAGISSSDDIVEYICRK